MGTQRTSKPKRQPHDFDTKTLVIIEYNGLDRNWRLFFAHSGLDRFIAIAGRILSKRIRVPETQGIDKPYFSHEDFLTVNRLACELLEMIGSQSNQRFGSSAAHQHRFFCKPGERETFPAHLFTSRWQETRDKLIRRNPENREKIEQRECKLPAFSKKTFSDLPATKKVRYCASELTATETRAVGVLYMLNLIWATAKDCSKHTSTASSDQERLALMLKMSSNLYSILDESDQMFAHAKGGEVGNKRARFFEAQEIVQELVSANPDLETKILVKRALTRIEGECLEVAPSARWVEDEIRELKKYLRRN